MARAAELVEGLKPDIAYAKRAEADANRLVEESESLEARLVEVSRLNVSNEDSLTTMTKRFEDRTSMLQDKQSEVLQHKEKMASL